MKLNKKAKEYFYLSGITNIPMRDWEIALTDIPEGDVDFNNISEGNVLGVTKFSMLLNKKTMKLSATRKIKIKVKDKKGVTDRLAIARSAIISFGDGGKFIVSVGEGWGDELKLSSASIYLKGEKIEINHFAITLP